MSDSQPPAILKARALAKGDRVAVISPAGRPESPVVLARCINVVKELGFEPVLGKSVMSLKGSMAGTDGERAEDLNGALADESIAGIFFTTGGWGSLRLLDRVDFEQIAESPKVMMGSCECTALLAAIHSRTGLVVFSGPNLDQITSRSTFERVRKAVTSQSIPQSITSADNDSPFDVPWAPCGGKAQGRTAGGNLTALTSLLGTPYEPEFKNRILFLEDTDEQNGILDRWLTHLYLAGHLAASSAVAFGQFPRCGTKGSDNMLSIADTFGDRLAQMQKTSCFGLKFGQTKDTAVVPTGCLSILDADTGVLEFLEPALL